MSSCRSTTASSHPPHPPSQHIPIFGLSAIFILLTLHWSKTFYFVGEAIDNTLDFLALRVDCRNHFQSFPVDPEGFEDPLEQIKSLLCLLVPVLEMAVSVGTAEQENTFRALAEGLQNIRCIDLSY